MGLGVGWEVGVVLGHLVGNKAWQDLAYLEKQNVYVYMCVCMCVCGRYYSTFWFIFLNL